MQIKYSVHVYSLDLFAGQFCQDLPLHTSYKDIFEALKFLDKEYIITKLIPKNKNKKKFYLFLETRPMSKARIPCYVVPHL